MVVAVGFSSRNSPIPDEEITRIASATPRWPPERESHRLFRLAAMIVLQFVVPVAVLGT